MKDIFDASEAIKTKMINQYLLKTIKRIKSDAIIGRSTAPVQTLSEIIRIVEIAINKIDGGKDGYW